MAAMQSETIILRPVCKGECGKRQLPLLASDRGATDSGILLHCKVQLQASRPKTPLRHDLEMVIAHEHGLPSL